MVSNLCRRLIIHLESRDIRRNSSVQHTNRGPEDRHLRYRIAFVAHSRALHYEPLASTEEYLGYFQLELPTEEIFTDCLAQAYK